MQHLIGSSDLLVSSVVTFGFMWVTGNDESCTVCFEQPTIVADRSPAFCRTVCFDALSYLLNVLSPHCSDTATAR